KRAGVPADPVAGIGAGAPVRFHQSGRSAQHIYAAKSHTMNSVTSQALPLEGIRVVEMSHMVMGPTCGMILADLGAEVIKVEPLTGDKTRELLGAGAGFFRTFNRNKKSISVDIK